jgi:hypothetical protein
MKNKLQSWKCIYVRVLTQNKKLNGFVCLAFSWSKIHNSRLGGCAERKLRTLFKSIFCTLHAFCMSHMQHSSTSSLRPLTTLLKLFKTIQRDWVRWIHTISLTLVLFFFTTWHNLMRPLQHWSAIFMEMNSFKQFKGSHSKNFIGHIGASPDTPLKLGTNLLHSRPHIFSIYIFYNYAITFVYICTNKIIQTRL